MKNIYTCKNFFWRLICSISVLVLSLPCFFSGIVGGNENFPLLRFLQILTLHEGFTVNEIFTFTLGVMAFFASIIFLVMIIGWIFNLPSHRYLKTLIVIGSICCFPNTLICLAIGNYFKSIDLLIIPSASLAFYLTFWYFSDQNQHNDSQDMQ
jgi:hypothetical protein